MLLMGAGASTPFEFRLARGLAYEFISSQEFVGRELHALRRMIKSIRRNRFIFDAEALMECLQGGARPHPPVKRAGPFIASMIRTQPIAALRRKCAYRCIKENLRHRFEEYLIAQYYKSDLLLEKRVKQMYDRLLSKVSGTRNWRSSEPPFSNSVFEIFTTNFDNSLDAYAEQTQQEFTRGFRIRGDRTVDFMPDLFEEESFRLRIFKLHGSVELSRLANGVTICDVPPSYPGYPGQYYGGSKILAKVMVYGLVKDVYSEPYLDLLHQLGQALQEVNVCTVVGYSFRDPWIRQIFQDTTLKRRPKEFRIRLIDPSASKVAESLRRLRPYIVPIQKTIQQFLELPS